MEAQEQTADSERRLRDEELAGRIRSHAACQDEATGLAVESLAHLFKTFGLAQERLNKRLEADGLTLAKFNVLVVLRSAPDRRLPMSEISERISVTCANVTKLVDGLERGGWARRAMLPGDRRVTLAELTPGGAERIERIMGTHFQNAARLWGAMSADDNLQLIHLLMKARRSIEGSAELQASEEDHAGRQ